MTHYSTAKEIIVNLETVLKLFFDTSKKLLKDW